VVGEGSVLEKMIGDACVLAVSALAFGCLVIFDVPELVLYSSGGLLGFVCVLLLDSTRPLDVSLYSTV